MGKITGFIKKSPVVAVAGAMLVGGGLALSIGLPGASAVANGINKIKSAVKGKAPANSDA